MKLNFVDVKKFVTCVVESVQVKNEIKLRGDAGIKFLFFLRFSLVYTPRETQEGKK
jgi:hypothetical protein